MMDVCAAAPQGSGFVASMTSYVDCQSQVLGSGAWAALSMPGSTLQVVLTGFLTITIALIGYNLLLGGSLTVRSGTLAFVKIGAVFALATSWPAYRTIVYDLVTDGPGQLVSEIGPRAGVVGSDGTLILRLDLTDRALVQLANLGTGTFSGVTTGEQQEIMPPPFAGFDSFALGGSRILFLMTAVGSLAIVRIVTGLMLALGPFFIAFLMFDGTRSLFDGWIRVLGGVALAGAGVSVALGLELAVLDPWLSNAIARRMAGEPLPTIAVELFVIASLFTILTLAMFYSCARLTRAFRLPAIAGLQFIHSTDRSDGARVSSTMRRQRVEQPVDGERTRAVAIASLIHSGGIREARQLLRTVGGGDIGSRHVEVRQNVSEANRQSVPLGRSFSRRPGARVSARAATRDARS